MSILLTILACTCGGPAVDGPAPAPSHFGQFDALVDAAARGDLATAQFVARSLEEGEQGEAPGADGSEEVGGALGFVQIAEDTEELADGVATAAAGCAVCHASTGATAPALEAWSHQTAARRMARATAFGVPEPPPADGPELTKVRAAWDGADDGEQLAEALVACASCHTNDDLRRP